MTEMNEPTFFMSGRMSFGKEVSPQQLAQAQQLARKKLVAECENAGQPVPRVLVVTDEEREALVANGKHDGTNDSIVIDVEDIFQVGPSYFMAKRFPLLLIYR